MPVSSMVSRSAVSTGERSPASLRPPGKLTWPLCRARCFGAPGEKQGGLVAAARSPGTAPRRQWAPAWPGGAQLREERHIHRAALTSGGACSSRARKAASRFYAEPFTNRPIGGGVLRLAVMHATIDAVFSLNIKSISGVARPAPNGATSRYDIPASSDLSRWPRWTPA